MTALAFGTLMTDPARAVTEVRAGVTHAMLELCWARAEPEEGVLDTAYLTGMRATLMAFQAAHMPVTLALGLYDPPAWAYALDNATYVNQDDATSPELNFVFSRAVRKAGAAYLRKVAAYLPMASFWAVRLTSGGNGEVLYPDGGYWAFDEAALTGAGLAAGMTVNPYPAWPARGKPRLTPQQAASWIEWYVGGLAEVTHWQMRVLARLGFQGYYQTVTPGSGTRPSALAAQARAGLLPADDGPTGVGAVWDLYYARLPVKAKVIAYVSSVADGSGDNDIAQPGDSAIPLTSPVMDSWSATRWITRVASENSLLTGGENPGYGMPASLCAAYTDTSPSGMMATAIAQARASGFTVFYWAHDFRLWDGTVPFSAYASAISDAP